MPVDGLGIVVVDVVVVGVEVDAAVAELVAMLGPAALRDADALLGLKTKIK